MIKFVYLIIGGATGTIARYTLSQGVHRMLGVSFPYGTFLVSFTEKKLLLTQTCVC